ncbi:MAG: SDR family oxidoreductase [Acidobacteriota bacterium]
MIEALENQWALILGASSGFGEAASLELSRAGMNIFGVHLDRKSTLANVERIRSEIRSAGKQSRFFNVNAADAEKREVVLQEIQNTLEQQGANAAVRVLLHSLAFGSLGRFFPEDGQRPMGSDQINMTSDVMAHSLVYWTQGLLQRNLIGEGTRIFAMTSSGGHRVWPSYGPVSAAKAALESHIRQLALELAPRGITANAIQAGVTDTPALRKIPGHEEMVESAAKANPGGRLTTPRDVGRALVALSHPYTQWMTGNVIRVDGGEDITS